MLGTMTMMVPRRKYGLQLATLPRKYFAIKNTKATTLTTATRHKIIDELPDEINNKI